MKRGTAYRLVCGGLRAGLALTAVLLAVGVARADQVTSKGTVLHGKITAVSSAGVTLEPEYGKGALAIKWADIEDLKSDSNFQLLYGEADEADAPLQGFSGGKLFVGPQLDGATMIDVATIESGVPIGPAGPSWQDRLRSSWRYWDGNLDLGFNLQQATTETSGVLFGFKTTRKEDSTRLIFGANYRYGTQKEKGQSRTITQDNAYGLTRGEYDITPRFYGFGSGDATYDAIQKLSIRAVPKGGLGYLFWEEKLDPDNRNFFSGEVGPGWVYEGFFHNTGKKIGPTPPIPPAVQLYDDSRNYFAIAFGANVGYHLPYGAKLDWRADYLPAADSKFMEDYLVRNAGSLTLPLIDPISAKFSLVDEYDNKPAGGANHNNLFLDFGLSLGW